MTVLVTGATGRLGPRLVARLQAEGRPVRVLTRRPFRADAMFPSGVDVHEWHPGSEPVPPAAVEGVSAVINLMGEPFAAPASALRLERMRASRVETAAKLVAALAGPRRPVRLVCVSVALPPLGAARDAEIDDTVVGEPASPLATDLAAAEAMAVAGRAKGLSVVFVRLGLLLAPGEPWRRLVRLARLGLMPPLAGAHVPVIDPEDAVAMLSALAARNDLDGIVHGMAPTPLAGDDLARLVASARLLPIGCRLPQAIAMRLLGPLAPALLCRSRLMPRRLLAAGASFLHPDPLPGATRTIAAVVAEEAWPWRLTSWGRQAAASPKTAREAREPSVSTPADAKGEQPADGPAKGG